MTCPCILHDCHSVESELNRKVVLCSRVLIKSIKSLPKHIKVFYCRYGDQALFFRKEVFQSVFGGFPCLPFMEDYELVCQAQSMIKAYASGPHKYPTSSTSWRICTVNGVVYSSLRRWEINGLVGNTVINQVSYIGF